VLQDQWGLSAVRAGLALTVVGLVWATASQAQSRLGTRVAHATAMRVGTALVLLGTTLITLAVWWHTPAVLAAGAYVLAGAGMGFAYPRTSVATLAASSDADRGFNTSALSIADSLGAALALSVSGIVFALAPRAGLDRFVAVFVLAAAIAVLGVVAAGRARTAPV
jgi:MFS family permease